MAELMTYREDATGWIVFSNPPRHNAVTYEMWRAVPEAVAQFERDGAVRVIALRGDGDKAFTTGADISEFEHTRNSVGANAGYHQVVEQANAALTNVSKPTLASIRGACYGGGLFIAAHCDLRICSDDSMFSLPAARLGLGYFYTGITRIAQLTGPAYCAELMYTARHYSAAEALHMRLVNRVVSRAELERVTTEYCTVIGENAPITLAAGKRCLVELYKDLADRDMRAVQAMIDACYLSSDYREGRTAFMQKRKPVFRGR
jgi:enoyl-CoA hydratase/carnithine racemase